MRIKSFQDFNAHACDKRLFILCVNHQVRLHIINSWKFKQAFTVTGINININAPCLDVIWKWIQFYSCSWLCRDRFQIKLLDSRFSFVGFVTLKLPITMETRFFCVVNFNQSAVNDVLLLLLTPNWLFLSIVNSSTWRNEFKSRVT